MKTLQMVLSAMIRNGKVTLETPGLDMAELRQALENRAERTLADIEAVVYTEEMTDSEKVAWIQARLEE